MLSYMTLVGKERFELFDYIFVNSKVGDEEDILSVKTIDETDKTLWIAQVLAIRAQYPWDVWIHVLWYYRPEEFPAGRQPYHGKKEIIKSSAEDFISVHTVAGHADVTHWKEMDDNDDAEGMGGLFWRQTFDPSTMTRSVTSLLLHLVSG